MGEQQYLDLIKDIINNGEHVKGRNGNTLTVFGRTMRFSLTNDKIPLLTSKKMAWKTCLKELLWFIHGKTDNKILKENKVNKNFIQFVDSKNRKMVDYMLSKMKNYIDVIIPRGGKNLVKRVQEFSSVPILSLIHI